MGINRLLKFSKTVINEQFRRHGAAQQTFKTIIALRAKAILRYGEMRFTQGDCHAARALVITLAFCAARSDGREVVIVSRFRRQQELAASLI